ncbi:hypothetical protein HGRIS_008917 [Hohenbuehelia grisea]|uniref:Uncharacterized protein n=1 Tax=Hohenbuehelia grisea TaxID=104357 RepID=A0ABR3IZH5_9AGAR
MLIRPRFRSLLPHLVRRIHLTQSYVEGPIEPPLDRRTLPQFWNDKILAHHASRPALVVRQEHPRVHAGPVSWSQVDSQSEKQCLRWTFEEMDRHVGALARGLVAMGVQPGDRVGVIMGNNSAYAMLQWACSMIDAILVTINPAYRLNELVNTLSLVGVKHLFVVPHIRTSSYVEMFAKEFPGLRESPPGSIEEPALPELRNLVVFDADYQNAANTPTPFTEIRDSTGIRCTIDWRDILLWGEDGKEARAIKDISMGQNEKDIVNLQFTSPVSFQTTPADPISKRVETVGKVQPHVKAKLVDETGKVVPTGVPGEIVVAGYLLQKGYWEDEAQTKQVMRYEDGTLWMYTGDEGIMDEEGYLRIVGRKKDIIIRGGENLFPVQIENALTSNHDILEAAVVAVPDQKYGEVVGAFVVRAPGVGPEQLSPEQVRRTVAVSMNPQVRSFRKMSLFQLSATGPLVFAPILPGVITTQTSTPANELVQQNAPAWVWFVAHDGDAHELPKTASGKVMKHVLRSWAKDLMKQSIGRVSP